MPYTVAQSSAPEIYYLTIETSSDVTCINTDKVITDRRLIGDNRYSFWSSRDTRLMCRWRELASVLSVTVLVYGHPNVLGALNQLSTLREWLCCTLETVTMFAWQSPCLKKSNTYHRLAFYAWLCVNRKKIVFFIRKENIVSCNKAKKYRNKHFIHPKFLISP